MTDRPRALHYAGLALLLAFVLVVRRLLDPWFGDHLPLATLCGVVALATWLGGWRLGLLLTVAGYLAADWLSIPPRGRFEFDAGRDAIGLGTYVVSCGIIVGFGEALRVSRRRERLARGELARNEARYRLALRGSPVAVWECDRDLRFTFVDNSQPPFADAAQILGRRDDELLEPDSARELVAVKRRVLDSGKGERSEVRVSHAGREHRFDYVCEPSEDGRGAIVGLRGVAVDVTERKRAEERAARLSEAAAVLLQAGDPDAMMRAVFAKIAPALGLDVYLNYMADDERATLRLVSSAGIPAEAAPALERLDYGAAVCGLVAQCGAPMSIANIQQSGDPRVALVQSLGVRAYACFPLQVAGGLLGTLSFGSRSRDELHPEDLALLETLSRYAAAAHERLRLIERLRQADRRKDLFLATLAHELRNPLAPIRSAAQVLKLKGSAEPDLAWCREVIERQAAQMARLLDDLLDVSRITRNKLELRRTRTPLAAIVGHAVETTRPLIDARRHELTVRLPGEPVYLDADPLRLEQVLTNVLNNAAKYTEPGGRIALSVAGQGAEVTISVVDTGSGIAAEALPQVFDVFYQAPAAPDISPGLGLGLALARGIVESHGGSIAARSDGLGRGSEFLVRLPVAPAAPALDQAPAAAAQPASLRSSWNIVVADDNRDAADSLTLLLKIAGHEVCTAYDGEEAVRVAATVNPDVVVLDISMPRLDGYAAARHIRQSAWGKDLVLVALSGRGQEADKLQSLEAGFNAHIVKPVDPATLVQVLAEVRQRRGRDVP